MSEEQTTTTPAPERGATGTKLSSGTSSLKEFVAQHPDAAVVVEHQSQQTYLGWDGLFHPQLDDARVMRASEAMLIVGQLACHYVRPLTPDRVDEWSQPGRRRFDAGLIAPNEMALLKAGPKFKPVRDAICTKFNVRPDKLPEDYAAAVEYIETHGVIAPRVQSHATRRGNGGAFNLPATRRGTSSGHCRYTATYREHGSYDIDIGTIEEMLRDAIANGDDFGLLASQLMDEVVDNGDFDALDFEEDDYEYENHEAQDSDMDEETFDDGWEDDFHRYLENNFPELLYRLENGDE